MLKSSVLSVEAVTAACMCFRTIYVTVFMRDPHHSRLLVISDLRWYCILMLSMPRCVDIKQIAAAFWASFIGMQLSGSKCSNSTLELCLHL